MLTSSYIKLSLAKWHEYVKAPEHEKLHSTAYIFSTILVLQLQLTCLKTSYRYSSHKLRIRKFGIVHKSTSLSASPFIARIQRKKETSGDVLFQNKRVCIFSAGWNGDDRPLEMSWLGFMSQSSDNDNALPSSLHLCLLPLPNQTVTIDDAFKDILWPALLVEPGRCSRLCFAS